jgi:tRNA-guanine transglycosylase
MSAMRFDLLAQDGAARRGRLNFARGTVETPAFMPVGTYGTVKAMTPEDLEVIGAEIVLANTFHLFLRPGLPVIRAHQGLHRFMHWRRPILTDSGGFQVWSLAQMRKITEEGAHFRSPVDGAAVFLSPEESMRIQRTLASDVAMSFDECTPYPATLDQARASMELSMRWARRSFLEYYREAPPGTLLGLSRAESTQDCGSNHWGPWSRLDLQGLPSAAWRWESRRKSANRCSSSCCRRCPRSSLDISWA